MPAPKRGRSRLPRGGLSLFESLRGDDTGDTSVPVDERSAQFRSIKSNIVQILNGRKGGAESTPEFGLVDLNDAVTDRADTMDSISLDIRRALSAYEPRLSGIKVHFDRGQTGGLRMMFHIEAAVTLANEDEQFLLDLVLTEGRKFLAS